MIKIFILLDYIRSERKLQITFMLTTLCMQNKLGKGIAPKCPCISHSFVVLKHPLCTKSTTDCFQIL